MRIVQAGSRIDLLITGRQVADAVRSKNLQLEVPFITGFAENAAIGNGHLDSGIIITKPFVNSALAD